MFPAPYTVTPPYRWCLSRKPRSGLMLPSLILPCRLSATYPGSSPPAYSPKENKSVFSMSVSCPIVPRTRSSVVGSGTTTHLSVLVILTSHIIINKLYYHVNTSNYLNLSSGWTGFFTFLTFGTILNFSSSRISSRRSAAVSKSNILTAPSICLSF